MPNIPYQLTVSPSSLWMFANMALWRARSSVGEQFHSHENEQTALIGHQRHLLATTLTPLPDLAVDMNQEFSYQIPYDTFSVRPEEIDLTITSSGGIPFSQWLNVYEPSLELKLQGMWETAEGYSYKAVIHEDSIYIADGIPGIRVIDIRDQTNPQLITTLRNDDPDSFTYGIALYDDYILSADGAGGMQVVDMNNFNIINHIATVHARTISIHSNYAFVVEHPPGLSVFDISQVTNIQNIAHINLPYSYAGAESDIDVDEHYIYILPHSSQGIQFIDISYPDNPIHVATLFTEQIYGFKAQHPYLYIAAIDSLLVYDITNIQEPVLLSNYPFDNQRYANLFGVTTSGDWAYLTTTHHLVCVDLNNQDTLSIVSTVDLDVSDGAWRTIIHDGYAYTVASTNGLRIVDLGLHWNIGGTPSIEHIGKWPLTISAQPTQEQTTLIIEVEAAPIVTKTTATQFTQPGDIFRFNVSDQAFYHPTDNLWVQSIQQDSGETLPNWLLAAFNPTIISTVPTSRAHDVRLQGDYAFIADIDEGLIIVNISNRNRPSIVSTYPVIPAYRLAVQENYVYVAAMPRKLEIIDVSDISAPQYVAQVSAPGQTHGVAVRGDYAYLANLNTGLQIADISEPYSPTIVSSLDTPGLAYHVVLHGNYAYLADGQQSKAFYIVDISNVTNPTIVANVSTPSYAWTMTFSGNHGFFVDKYFGFSIVNIAEPHSPKTLSSISTPSFCNQVLIANNYAIAISANPYNSAIYDISDMSNPKFLLTTSESFKGNGADIQGVNLFLAGGGRGLHILDISSDTWFIQGTPTKEDHDVYEISVTVRDKADKTVTDTFTLSVNHLPQQTEALGNATVNVGQTFNKQVPAELYLDLDKDDLTFSATQNGTVLSDWLTFNPLIRKFTGTPDHSNAGEFPVTLQVDDGHLGVIKTTFWITVNIPPEFIATTAEATVLVQVGETFSRSLDDWFYDADGHRLAYQVSYSDGSPLAWMHQVPANATLWGNPSQHDNGVHHLQIVADDRKGGQVTAYATVRVNSNPILNYVINTNYTAYVGEPFNLQFPYTTFIDAEGDTLTYVAYQIHNETDQSPLSGWLSFDSDAQKFIGTPTPNNKGLMRVRLGVFDGNGGEAFVEIPIEVPNRPPKIQTVILPPSAQIWQLYEYPINPATVVIDLDGDTLTPTMSSYDGKPLSSWLSFDVDKWLLYGRPGVIPWQGKDVNLRFRVGDGESEVETEIIVPVGIEYMVVVIGSVYAATGVFFLASNLITKWVRACLLRIVERTLTAAAEYVASVESNRDMLQTRYRNMNQALRDKDDDILDKTKQYTEQMKHCFLTTAQTGCFDQVHPWHAIRDSIAEIKQRIVTSTEGTHAGYQRYLPNDVEWCAGLALLTQTALLIQNHIGRKASCDERKHYQKELKTMVDAIEGDTAHAVAVRFHLACAQAALVCMEDSYHWLSLDFLIHLAAVTLSPPNGAFSLSAALKDIPAGWYPRLVMVQQLAQMAIHDDNDVFRQVLALRNASNDWRFVYGYTLAMQEIVAHCRNEQITSQARTQLQALQGFSQFRVQRFNGCCFFGRCCQNRNYWIRRQAERNIEAPAQIEADAGAAVEMMVAPNVPPPVPPPGNGM